MLLVLSNYSYSVKNQILDLKRHGKITPLIICL